MTVKRFGYISIAVALLAVMIWVSRSPMRETSPAASQPLILDSQPRAERGTNTEPQQPTTEVTAALADAEAEIERLRSELATAAASSEDKNETEGSFEPTGYADRARVWVNDASAVFDSELVDATWAPVAETELYEKILNRISTDGIQVNIVDVRCKTDACRVQMSFPVQPANRSELGAITAPAVQLARQLAREADSVSFSGLIRNRGLFPGEPVTSELYLFRSGNDGIVHTVETPQGPMILDLAGLNPGSNAGR